MSLPPSLLRRPLHALVAGTLLLGLAGCPSGYDASRDRFAASAPFRCRTVEILDGDSMLVELSDGHRLQVRIASIDAPEKGQPHADASRQALRELLSGRQIDVVPIKLDRYGRTVGRVLVGSQDAGLAQVDAGAAWHFARFAAEQTPSERDALRAAERAARAAGRGLWADPSPTPPWRFRAEHDGGRRNAPLGMPARR